MDFRLFFILLIALNTGIPPLNKSIVRYVKSVIGTQVDRGECWDLAAAALGYAGAYLDRSSEKTLYIFGKPVVPGKDKIYPGDIIQMENVKIETSNGNAIITERMEHHTAIIMEVLADGQYKIAHQNTSFSKKKVGISELNLNNIKHGKVFFYRPYKK